MTSPTRGPMSRRPRGHVPRHSTRGWRPAPAGGPHEAAETGPHGLLLSVLDALRRIDPDERAHPEDPPPHVVDLDAGRGARIG